LPKERFDEKLKGKIEVEYVFQEITKLPKGYTCPEGREKPWGTGHAILMAKDVIKEPFAAINADDFYGAPAFQCIADFFVTQVSGSTYCMVGYLIKNTLSENGTVSRGICKTDEDQNLVEITERHQIRREGKAIVFEDENKSLVEVEDNTPASMNFWGFHPSLFVHLENQFKAFLDEKIELPKSEFYIPSVVFELIKADTIKTKVLQADSPCLRYRTNQKVDRRGNLPRKIMVE